ncbi:uncharacterized protein EI90DRAFT_3020535 [Cantharellus anzutake]|uniref:uncharacterized protein n=1 Tax=Cantharellus anzutake TaxID=1750568 RepID=UPI001907ABA4|nr:uncharacterized protein EI90DRAFT_3020535 [Cantharellus anzutake]KAF8320628.1 hypothetical protein EI90DRAFT_3020535 [Cantharellus anzutake]
MHNWALYIVPPMDVADIVVVCHSCFTTWSSSDQQRVIKLVDLVTKIRCSKALGKPHEFPAALSEWTFPPPPLIPSPNSEGLRQLAYATNLHGQVGRGGMIQEGNSTVVLHATPQPASPDTLRQDIQSDACLSEGVLVVGARRLRSGDQFRCLAASASGAVVWHNFFGTRFAGLLADMRHDGSLDKNRHCRAQIALASPSTSAAHRRHGLLKGANVEAASASTTVRTHGP